MCVRLASSCSCLLALVVAACPSPIEAPRTSVRVATWNAARVFDATCDTGRCGPDAPEGSPTPSEVEADVIRVGRAVRGLEADALVLVEIETSALAQRIAQAAGEGANVAMGDSGPGTIDVAVLSRLAVLEVRAHRPTLALAGRTVSATRVMLEVHLDMGARRLVVLAAHLKSKRDDDPERRLAEARALGALARAASARHPEAVVVVAGDLNDTPSSGPLDALEHDHGLALLTRGLPVDEAYTFGSGSRRSLIDHVLLVPRSFVSPGIVSVARGDTFGYGGSDHAAVRATLDVR